MDTITLTRGVPPTEAFPADQLSQCFDSVLHEDTAVVLQYGQQQGYPPLRRLLADEYAVSDNEIMVGNGSLHLQDLLASYLVRPGMLVITEQPSYDRAIATFRRRGAKVVGVPLDPDGINIERLEAVLAQETPAFLYLIPDFQNPAGVTLSAAKRQRIVELATKHGFFVVEDVPYRRLRYRGKDVPLMREFDPEWVITMASFSKLLSPALRVGYMVAPAAVCAAITKLGEDTYLSPVLPTQAAVAEYLSRGWLEPNIARLKALYVPRWEAMNAAIAKYLPQAVSAPADGGFFASVTLPPEANSANLVARARDVGLVLTPGAAFFADSDNGQPLHGERFVRLPFCAVTPAQIDEGVRRLSTLL